jgi:hypothetical protein
VIGLVCHRRWRTEIRQLDAGVEASGPHDFAVRFSAVRYRRIHVHRIPPRVRDDREPPLKWDETAIICEVIWVGRKEEIFLQKGLDRQITDLPVGQFPGLSANQTWRGHAEIDAIEPKGHWPEGTFLVELGRIQRLAWARFGLIRRSLTTLIGSKII